MLVRRNVIEYQKDFHGTNSYSNTVQNSTKRLGPVDADDLP